MRCSAFTDDAELLRCIRHAAPLGTIGVQMHLWNGTVAKCV